MILTARYIDAQIIHGHSGIFHCLVRKLSLLFTITMFTITIISILQHTEMVIRGGRTTGCKYFISGHLILLLTLPKALSDYVPYTAPSFRLCGVELFIPFSMSYSLIPLHFSFSYLCSRQQRLRRGTDGRCRAGLYKCTCPYCTPIITVKCI
jgi:hypothetical protein